MTAFVHVVDCRAGAGGGDGSRRRRLLRPACRLPLRPVLDLLRRLGDAAGHPDRRGKGYHHDDWEGVQLRFGPDGEVAERASSHNGYNYRRRSRNWGSDADIGPLKWGAEAIGARPENGWGPETGLLFVSGGSHAGNALATFNLDQVDHFTPGRRVHLIPLEDVAPTSTAHFAISPPWLKDVWFDPEAEGTS